jgi:murein DD-endopeptidase MepM/ murein hydrolase activator NlpD
MLTMFHPSSMAQAPASLGDGAGAPMSQPTLSYHLAGNPQAVGYDDAYEDGTPSWRAPRQRAAAARAEPYPQDAMRTRRGHADHAEGRRAGRRDYTFGHGERQVRIGPVAFWICVGTLVIMAAWAGLTATYFAFHDDVLARLIARQAAMQFAYEDRIADMRAQIDRVTSRQLLDQEQFEQRLNALAKQEAALEARTSSLGALNDPAITGTIRPPARSLAPQAPVAPLKPSPINGTAVPQAPAERDALLMRGGVAGALARIEASLARVDAAQTASLDALDAAYDAKLKRMRGVLAELGLNLNAHPPSEAIGGPFVPYRLAAGATPFEQQVHRIALERAQADQLAHELAALPIRKPVPGELDTSSTFGVRIDPFLNRPAMHTGIDFRGVIGEAVRATASGTVTIAGWSGGYGRMVEVDHGNGLSTRYGHLSEIEVKVGQVVKINQVVGRLGSTGRSTGPHLHYETRINGEAVDPDRFLRAGMRVGLIQ